MEDFFESKNTSLSGLTQNLAPSDEGENIFGAWVSAEFQNRNKVLNGTNFFTFAPTSFLTYYWSVVLYNIQWYFGNVYGIHDRGIISTNMGAKVCKMSAQLTMSGGYRFEGDKLAEKFLTAFDKKSRLENKLKAELPQLNAIGFMLGKVDLQTDGNCDITFISGNKYFAQIDNERNVTAFYALIKLITADVGNDEAEGYYLVEERYYKRGKPIQRYRVYKGPAIATAPTENEGANGLKGLAFEELTVVAQRVVQREIGKDALNREFVLPFKNIGAVVVLNTFAATGMEQYKQFGDSTLNDIHSSLYELDWTHTIKMEHKYIAQDFVAFPSTSIPQERFRFNDEGRDIARQMTRMAGFNKRLVKSVDGVDPTKQVPYAYQPTLKIEEYNADIDRIMSEIATGAQFSPVTLNSQLVDGGQKTATEVRADERTTSETIKEKRKLVTENVNKLLEIVLEHYGISGSASMVFNYNGITNTMEELQMLEIKQRNGWISQKTATMQANPQYSQEEAVDEYMQAQEQSAYAPTASSFGDYVNEKE